MDPQPTVSFWASLRWSDIIAIIGALAWLPYLIRLFRRPRVSAVVGLQIEIGFTGLGAILNPSIAYRTQHREALLTNFRSVVTHENQQQTRFRGVQLTEMGEMAQSTGASEGITTYVRTQAAAALVVVQGEITERKIQCMEVNRKAVSDPLVVAYQRTIRRLQVADANAWLAAVQASAEYHALRDFWRNSFVWQAGEYRATVACNIDESTRTVDVSFQFTLTDQEIILLRDNNNGLDWELRRIWAQYSLQPIGHYQWQWVYPEVRMTEGGRRANA